LADTAQGGGLEDYRESAEDLLNDVDSISLVAAAIKLLTKQPDVTPVKITEELPNFRRRRGSGPRRHFDGDRPRRRFHNGEGRGDRGDRHFEGKRRRFDGNRGPKGQSRPKNGKNIHESNFKPYFKEGN